jgi:hypothetical protein
MKSFLQLLFLTVGSWNLKNTNDVNKISYSRLEIKKDNEIIVGFFPIQKTFLYDEKNELLLSNDKNVKCTITVSENSLSLINHSEHLYYTYEKLHTKSHDILEIKILLLSIILMNIYQVMLECDTITVLISNIMRSNNHI